VIATAAAMPTPAVINAITTTPTIPATAAGAPAKSPGPPPRGCSRRRRAARHRPGAQRCPGRRRKVLPLPFDVLVHAWLDLAADAPPAVLHREFFHCTGAFRAGPPVAEFEELLGRFAVATDPGTLGELTTDIDRFVYDQALSVFLCAPQALYAVNRQVAFDGYAATFELAETQASPQHWSRR
jgi:hypothetical protein